MENSLLKSLLAEMLDYPEEETRVGVFACFSRDYDQFAYLCKLMLLDEKLKDISDNENKIVRNPEGSSFFVEDTWGGKDNFTLNEILFFVDLWDKAQNLPFNLIYMNDKHSEMLATGITNNDAIELEKVYDKIAKLSGKKRVNDIL